MSKPRRYQIGVRPKHGTKAAAVLVAIEQLHERAATPVTRNQLLAHCPMHIDCDDINALVMYLRNKGFLCSVMVQRVAKTGPARVEAFALV